MPPTPPPLAEMPANDRLQVMQRWPRVAVLSDISRRLLQQSRMEHREMLEMIGQEGDRDRREAERDRTLLGQAFNRNFDIMESAVAVMAEIRDILKEKNTAKGVADNTAQHPSAGVAQPCALMLAPATDEVMPEILVEDSQQEPEKEQQRRPHSPSQSLLSGRREQGKPQRALVKATTPSARQGCPRERRCRGQKRDRYSP